MNFKSLIAFSGMFLFLLSCSKENITEWTAVKPQEPLSRQDINAIVDQTLQRTNDVFYWDAAGDLLLWSALVRSDSVAGIGYQPAGESNIKEKIHLVDVASPAWVTAREKIINTLIDATRRAYPGQRFDRGDLILEEDDVLPIIYVRLFHLDLTSQLRRMPEVRYIEPLSYTNEEVDFRSDSGCGVSPASSIPTADYVTTSPNVKIPWNFNNGSIPSAWPATSGSGVTVALLDTGTSPSQPKLGSEFNSGLSQGRFIQRLGTYVSSWWWWASPDGPDDQCGHGTQMAGLIAAPRGSGGSSVGVAYNTNLLAIRVTGDVVVNSSNEKRGVKDGLIIAGNRSDVKVISMSIGDVFYSSTVADGIFYAYNRGKLIFAAAGTSTSITNWWGVIFPANMAETVAVTGVKEGGSLQRCNTCHSGSAVDFVAVMQRSNDNSRTSLTLAMSGNQPAYVGGSSAATAITAGIAALVWSTNPAQSRSDVMNRLKNAAQLYPARDGEYGWGIINAAQAVN